MKTCLICDFPISVKKTYCLDCLPAVKQIQSQAQAIMFRANLPRPKGLACVDCNAPGYGYDHRYYASPLDVVPVCAACNIARGPALDIRPLTRRLLGMDGHAITFKPPKPVKQVKPPICIDLQGMLDFAERKEIDLALAKARYNKTKAAKLLGISFRSLRYRLNRLHIDC